MKREDLISAVKADLAQKTLVWLEKSPKRIYIDIKPEDIIETAKYFHFGRKARFNIASGIDTPQGLEILYHFSSDKEGVIFTLRVLLTNKKKPEISSIAPLFKGAEWIEREMWELLGINFKGHPDLRKLLLADDWPEGQYPLRRDYKGDK